MTGFCKINSNPFRLQKETIQNRLTCKKTSLSFATQNFFYVKLPNCPPPPPPLHPAPKNVNNGKPIYKHM